MTRVKGGAEKAAGVRSPGIHLFCRTATTRGACAALQLRDRARFFAVEIDIRPMRPDEGVNSGVSPLGTVQ